MHVLRPQYIHDGIGCQGRDVYNSASLTLCKCNGGSRPSDLSPTCSVREGQQGHPIVLLSSTKFTDNDSKRLAVRPFSLTHLSSRLLPRSLHWSASFSPQKPNPHLSVISVRRAVDAAYHPLSRLQGNHRQGNHRDAHNIRFLRSNSLLW